MGMVAPWALQGRTEEERLQVFRNEQKGRRADELGWASLRSIRLAHNRSYFACCTFTIPLYNLLTIYIKRQRSHDDTVCT